MTPVSLDRRTFCSQNPDMLQHSSFIPLHQLSPKPPDLKGQQISFQATFPLPISGPDHKNPLQIFSIVFKSKPALLQESTSFSGNEGVFIGDGKSLRITRVSNSAICFGSKLLQLNELFRN